MIDRKKVLWQSLLLAVLIFSLGIILNHALDFVRIGAIVDVMQEHELDRDAYQVENLFAEEFEGDKCGAMSSRIIELKREIHKVGEDLGSYSRFSFFKKKDFDYLKRRYFLLQLRFFSLIQRVNAECGDPYIPILFFYEIDDEASERQGFVLQELSEDFNDRLIVLSLDLEYEDEPLVGLLADYYNVDQAPSVIIGGKKLEGLTYTGMLNATVLHMLRIPDPSAENINFSFTVKAAGVNQSRLISMLTKIMADESADPFARGDAALIIGRLTNNESLICRSLGFYDRVQSVDPEDAAILYETSAAIGCGRNRKAFLLAAADAWEGAGNTFRADLDRALSTGTMPQLRFDKNATSENTTVISGYFSPILPSISANNVSNITIGSTEFIFPSNSTFLTQVDRVHRDWISGQLQNPFNAPLLVTFSERLYYNESELLTHIGWHEGARTRDLVRNGLTYKVSPGTLVARHKDRWFAVDDKGVFRFEVPADKLLYPTTRFLHEDLAVIIDTHGVNMLVEQAIRKKVDFVLSDCDHPGKVYAAKYLSDNNISVVCFPDKYVYLAMGHNLSLAGSPPFEFVNSSYVKIGGRPITIYPEDRIVVVNASDQPYALWYYQTPTSYFNILEKTGLNVTYVSLSSFGEMKKATAKAREIDASILATRVFNEDDYADVKSWLLDRPDNKVILFHSASYPYGQKLFSEFQSQTTFDDPNPVIR